VSRYSDGRVLAGRGREELRLVPGRGLRRDLGKEEGRRRKRRLTEVMATKRRVSRGLEVLVALMRRRKVAIMMLTSKRKL